MGWLRSGVLAGALALSALSVPAAGQGWNRGGGGGGGYLGTAWTGHECCGWEFTWVMRPRGLFAGAWRHPGGETLLVDDMVVSHMGGGRVRIIRQGGSNAGGCTYDGVIRGGQASGTYACRGSPAGDWYATIQ
jgi:hypothetical protein